MQELEHYVTPHLQDQKADATIKHIGCDNIDYRDLSEIGIYKLQRISLIQEQNVQVLIAKFLFPHY